MPPIELGPLRPIGAADVRIARQAGGLRERGESTSETVPTAQLSEVVDPGEAPIDIDRVDLIKKAVERGTYPVVPAKIADAIIAAGILLRKGE